MNFLSKIINQLYVVGYNIRKYFSMIVSETYVKVYLIVIVVLNAIVWFAASSIKDKISSERMALHYNVDFGINFYDSSEKIYIIPLVGFFILFINFVLYLGLLGARDRKFISHILFLVSIISNLVLLTALMLIFLVNFR